MAMRKVSVDGKTLNKRTADMLKRAEKRLGLNLYVLQGSYNAGGVGASAGTHDGGGAVDLSVSGYSFTTIREIVRQLRECGFAAWYREALPGVWGPHIHAIAIGDPELASGAKYQVTAYYSGRDGLAANGPDTGPKVTPIPVWPIKLPGVSYFRIIRQFKSKTPRASNSVRRVQRLLNYRLGANLIVDGIAGNKTKAAYKSWEVKCRINKPDGIPGRIGLNKLFAGWAKSSLLAKDK